MGRLSEYVLHFIEKIPLLGKLVIFADLGQLLKNMPLLFRKFCRHDNIHGDELISSSSFSQTHNPLIAQAENGTALSALRYLELLFPLESRNGDLRTQDCLSNTNWHLAIDVVSLPLEERVFFHVDHHIEIS